MDYRSTGQHITNDIVSNVGSSHGVQLAGGSTGGIVAAVGDDANIGLTVRPKGTATLTLGDGGAQTITLNAGAMTFGSLSTTTFGAIQRYRIDFTPPAMEASTWVESTYTVAGLTTGGALVFTPRLSLMNASTGGNYVIWPRCSTAAELVLLFHNASASTISAQSTASGTLIHFRI